MQRHRALIFATEKALPNVFKWVTKNDAKLQDPVPLSWEMLARIGNSVHSPKQHGSTIDEVQDRQKEGAMVFSALLRNKATSFDVLRYRRSLKTVTFGQLLCHQPVVDSTQTMLIDAVNNFQSELYDSVLESQDAFDSTHAGSNPFVLDGTAIVADVQEHGKGRGENVWVSPQGSLSVSFVARYSNGSTLPFVQYLVPLAVITAIKSKPGLEDLPLHIKWPNDIYVNRKTKVGGILCNSQYDGRTFSVVIGFGVNLNNSHPTTCINDVIREHITGAPARHGGQANHLDDHDDDDHINNGDLAVQSNKEDCTHVGTGRTVSRTTDQGFVDDYVLTREELLARFFNSFEKIQDEFMTSGFQPFQKMYTDNWLHTNQEVQVERRKATMAEASVEQAAGFAAGITPELTPARITGIATSGNLTVQFVDGNGKPVGAVEEVIPDTTSFDMLQGLVTHKRR